MRLTLSRSPSLRHRVWLPLAAVVLPMFCYSAITHWLERNAAIDDIERRIRQFVHTGLVQAGEDESRALALLRIAARSKDLATLDPGECNGLAQRLMETQTNFIDIGAASLDGTVFCSADRSKLGTRVAGQAWFEDALNRRDFTGMEVLPGTGRDRPFAIYGYPIVGSNRQLKAMAFAVAPANWFGRLTNDETLPSSWKVALLHRNGTVLASRGAATGPSSPAVADAIAERLPEPGQAAAVMTGRSPDRFYGIGQLPGRTDDLFLLADTAQADALHDIDAHFRLHLAILLSVTLFAALLGHMDSKRVVVAWAERLQQTVRRFASGETGVRVAYPSPVRELGDIDRAINKMADELAAAGSALRYTEQRWLMALEGAGHGVWDWDVEGAQVFYSRRWLTLLGLDKHEVTGTLDDWEGRIHPDDLPAHRRCMEGHLNGEDVGIRSEHRLLCKDGSYRWFLCQGMIVSRHADGRPRRAIGTQTEIEWRRRAEDRLRLADRVFSQASEAIIITDGNNRIVKINEAFCVITGYTEAEVLGQSPSILKSGLHGDEFYRELWQKLTTHGCWQGQILNKRRNGEVFPEGLTISVVRDEAGRITNYLGIFSDISALESSRQRLEYLATHDALTALPNRALFSDRLHQALEEAKRDDDPLAVLFVDLDNFKVINDSLGHEFGDRVLSDAARRMADCVRTVDTIARLGGDEFTIALRGADETHASAIAQRVMESLARPFVIEGKDLFVTASIGISRFPADGADEGSLLRNADVAMYHAKERGKNQTQYFNEDMEQIANRRLDLETGLRHAIERRGFTIAYQPKIQVRSDAVIGAEALVRWVDANLGMIGPAEFIPLAEKCGLIGEIGRQVVEMVVADIARWQAEGIDVPRIYVNVSPFQLRDGHFNVWFREHLASAGVQASSIGIEMTEGTLMEQGPREREQLDVIARMGISISIDDFGTGYSSLAYLKRFPISELKIDRSFVCDIDRNPDGRAIARAVMHMAHALGLVVVAEGVESQSQLDVLAQLGCDMAQGYLFHAPLDPDTFARLLDVSERPDRRFRATGAGDHIV